MQFSRFLPLILILAISAFFAFLVKDFVREVIVLPLLQAVWYLTLILRSFPDLFFWTIFVLVAIFIAVKSLFRDQDDEPGVRRDRINSGGAVSLWSRLIDHAQDGGYSQWQLSQSLCKLTWDMLRDSESRSMRHIENNLRDEVLDLPPEIQAYFEAGLLPYQPMSGFKHRLKLKRAPSPLDLDPARVVEYLEEKFDPLTGENE